jgi:hypothetical protein
MAVARVYFAHPKATYPEVIPEIEGEMIAAIEGLLPAKLGGFGFDIVNPSLPEHQEACKKLFEEQGGGAGMKYFTDIVDSCAAVVYAPYPILAGDDPKGMIGAGVVMEAGHALEAGKPVFELSYRLDENDKIIIDSFGISPVEYLEPARLWDPKQTSARNQIYRDKYHSTQQASDLRK